jgi:hypothetical protein
MSTVQSALVHISDVIRKGPVWTPASLTDYFVVLICPYWRIVEEYLAQAMTVPSRSFNISSQLIIHLSFDRSKLSIMRK